MDKVKIKIENVEQGEQLAKIQDFLIKEGFMFDIKREEKNDNR